MYITLSTGIVPLENSVRHNFKFSSIGKPIPLRKSKYCNLP